MHRPDLVVPLAGTLFLVACAGDDASIPPLPDDTSLAATGLYADVASGTLASGVLEYRPEFELWSDGAAKRRFLSVPDGTTIDTSDPDRWIYPPGTRAWKEFTRGGVRVETRYVEKLDDGSWLRATYLWNADQSGATLVAEGVPDAAGTPHDVPDLEACGDCHDSAADWLLGVTAIQLDHDLGGGLSELADAGWLSAPPSVGAYALPGDDTEQAALGYLHANCGNCHREGAGNPLRLWLEVGSLDSVERTPTHATAVGEPSHTDDPLGGTDATVIVAPGDPDGSLLFVRMSRRGNGGMPWLGTEDVDDEGLGAVRAWIEAMGATP